MFERILVVCVGNICRSPMGEALLAQALPERRVHSAGLGALVGQPADETARTLLLERGVDISAHRARQLTEELIRRHDLILVMESGHRRAVEAIDPSARGRIYRWGEWGDFEVPDPYRQPREVFEQSLELILRGLDDWLVKLKA